MQSDLQRSLTEIIDDTYDFSEGFGRKIGIADFFADGIFVRKVLSRQRLVDDDDAWAHEIVVLGEELTAKEPGLEGGEEIGANIASVYFIGFSAVAATEETNRSCVAAPERGNLVVVLTEVTPGSAAMRLSSCLCMTLICSSLV